MHEVQFLSTALDLRTPIHVLSPEKPIRLPAADRVSVQRNHAAVQKLTTDHCVS